MIINWNRLFSLLIGVRASTESVSESLENSTNEKFIFKVPTNLTSFFRRRGRKYTMKIVPKQKKNNLFYFYIKVELTVHTPSYYDLEEEYDENGLIHFPPLYPVDLGNKYQGCFQLINHGKEKTEDGYIKGKITEPMMKEFIRVKREVINNEK